MNLLNPDMQACYNAALADAPEIAGRIQLRFQILPDGSVAEVTVLDSALPEGTTDCISNVVRAHTFDAFEGGEITVERTYRFSPDPSDE